MASLYSEKMFNFQLSIGAAMPWGQKGKRGEEFVSGIC